MGSTRFIFNPINTIWKLYRKKATQHGMKPSWANKGLFNVILNDLKEHYPFLKKANSTVLQKKDYDNLIVIIK